MLLASLLLSPPLPALPICLPFRRQRKDCEHPCAADEMIGSVLYSQCSVFFPFPLSLGLVFFPPDIFGWLLPGQLPGEDYDLCVQFVIPLHQRLVFFPPNKTTILNPPAPSPLSLNPPPPPLSIHLKHPFRKILTLLDLLVPPSHGTGFVNRSLPPFFPFPARKPFSLAARLTRR